MQFHRRKNPHLEARSVFALLVLSPEELQDFIQDDHREGERHHQHLICDSNVRHRRKPAVLSRQTQLANPIVPVQWANRKDLCQERRVQNDLTRASCETTSHWKLSLAERRNGQRQNLVGEDGSMMASQREKARGNNPISCSGVCVGAAKETVQSKGHSANMDKLQ